MSPTSKLQSTRGSGSGVVDRSSAAFRSFQSIVGGGRGGSRADKQRGVKSETTARHGRPWPEPGAADEREGGVCEDQPSASAGGVEQEDNVRVRRSLGRVSLSTSTSSASTTVSSFLSEQYERDGQCFHERLVVGVFKDLSEDLISFDQAGMISVQFSCLLHAHCCSVSTTICMYLFSAANVNRLVAE